MPICALLIPQAILRYRLWLLFIQFSEPLDRDVEIADRAQLRVQPLKLIRYFGLLAVGKHRGKKQNGCAQVRERNAHSMQSTGIAFTCRLMIVCHIL